MQIHWVKPLISLSLSDKAVLFSQFKYLLLKEILKKKKNSRMPNIYEYISF